MPYCSSCGNELRGDSKFCAECGQLVPEPAGGGAGAAPAAPPVQSVAASYPPPTPPPPSVQTVAAFTPPPPSPPFPGARRRSLKWLWIGGAAAAVVIAVVCVLVFVVFKGGDGGNDSKAVEKTVRQLFTAMEKQDVELLFSLMDPAILGAMPMGEARDTAMAAVKAELGTLGKMKFSGIEMKVEMTSPTTATVTLTEGKATITDANGKTTTEDIKDSSTPSTMDMVKQDGKWYMASNFFQ